MGRSLKLSQHQRALTVSTHLWFKTKWQSIIELSGAAYCLLTEFRHPVWGSKEHRFLLIQSESRRGGLGTPGTSGTEELSTCVLTSTSASLEQQLNIIMSNRGVDVPITWDFPLEERRQFLMENCSSLSRQGLDQAERAKTFPKPLPPYPPFLQGLS